MLFRRAEGRAEARAGGMDMDIFYLIIFFLPCFFSFLRACLATDSLLGAGHATGYAEYAEYAEQMGACVRAHGAGKVEVVAPGISYCQRCSARRRTVRVQWTQSVRLGPWRERLFLAQSAELEGK